MKYGLTEYEQRGNISYVMGDGTLVNDVPGWFKLQVSQYGHEVVAMRKIGGRNWHIYCLTSVVCGFNLYKKESK